MNDDNVHRDASVNGFDLFFSLFDSEKNDDNISFLEAVRIRTLRGQRPLKSILEGIHIYWSMFTFISIDMYLGTS